MGDTRMVVWYIALLLVKSSESHIFSCNINYKRCLWVITFTLIFYLVRLNLISDFKEYQLLTSSFEMITQMLLIVSINHYNISKQHSNTIWCWCSTQWHEHEENIIDLSVWVFDTPKVIPALDMWIIKVFMGRDCYT